MNFSMKLQKQNFKSIRILQKWTGTHVSLIASFFLLCCEIADTTAFMSPTVPAPGLESVWNALEAMIREARDMGPVELEVR